ATPEGIPAIEDAIAEGININITLIFALEMYERVIAAYLTGLRRRHERGESLDVHSVASFFVSRVDTAVDKLLDAKLAEDPSNPLLESLHGKAAIANAVCAYELFLKAFHQGPEFTALREAGAHVQRPLWASTSAKNPNYRDVVYAEALVGPETVDTMPLSTIEAFQDHGVVESDTVKEGMAEAHQVLDELEAVGVDMAAVTADLLAAGVRAFDESYDALIRRIAEKVDALHHGYGRRQRLDLGSLADPVSVALAGDGTAGSVVQRMWDRDAGLWKRDDPAHAAVIRNRLGWLELPRSMRSEMPRLIALGGEVEEERIRDAVLLGMGGSSLCPEVLRQSFGSAGGHPTLHVLDTTDPAAIKAVSDRLDVRSTIFIVSSKSGTTLEPLCQLDHFWEVVSRTGTGDPGRHFIAVTDPGSPLADIARQRRFRHVFENPPDIGGRYSALSFFGLVPATIIGVDVERLLERAASMQAQCSRGVPADLNCGAVLGTVMAQAWERGRDKVTIVAPGPIASFALWAEQLLAESTGKEGKGLVPIGEEPLGDPSRYGDDRLFVALKLDRGDESFGDGLQALRSAGQPVVTLSLEDLYDLGAEFFRWEAATAVAAATLRIDPFDEPNVQESKDNTNRVLAAFEREGSLPEEPPEASDELLAIHGGGSSSSPETALTSFLDQLGPGDYTAVMAYLTPDARFEQALKEVRVAIRDHYRVATTLGFGPRFLHSTGQLHKGGPANGLYLQITADDAVDVPIPGRAFSFSTLKRAQALGDLQSLRSHGRRALRVHLHGEPEAGLRRLAELVTQGAAVTG
ncbi:MAG TPA: bifunctional transaldolase/phosoglucose isomerase, partial [Candidatus Sulfotelmatobacter sp.]|nr:bifunctional transaldolase/phosoglucose isomerase [Candidatus Sulfotelmatobacter sp.]